MKEELKTIEDYKKALRKAKVKISELRGELLNCQSSNQIFKELYEGKKK